MAIDDSTIEQTVEEKIRQAVQVLEQQGQQQQLVTNLPLDKTSLVRLP